VTLRDRLFGLLSRGEASPHDPDERVEIARVPLSQAPLLVEGLRSEGFDARFGETFNAISKMSTDARIDVRRADVEAATAALDRLR